MLRIILAPWFFLIMFVLFYLQVTGPSVDHYKSKCFSIVGEDEYHEAVNYIDFAGGRDALYDITLYQSESRTTTTFEVDNYEKTKDEESGADLVIYHSRNTDDNSPVKIIHGDLDGYEFWVIDNLIFYDIELYMYM